MTKKECIKFIAQIIVLIASAVLTALGAMSCMRFDNGGYSIQYWHILSILIVLHIIITDILRTQLIPIRLQMSLNKSTNICKGQLLAVLDSFEESFPIQ